jgi:hypothetical protein
LPTNQVVATAAAVLSEHFQHIHNIELMPDVNQQRDAIETIANNDEEAIS